MTELKHRKTTRKSEDGLSEKKHRGTLPEIRPKRGWRDHFTDSEREGLREALKKKYSDELVELLEKCAQRYFQRSAQTYVKKPANERKRAQRVRDMAEKVLDLLCGVGTCDGPPDDLEHFLEQRAGGFQQRNKVLDVIHWLGVSCQEYLDLHPPGSLPKRPPIDGWKKMFASDVAFVLLREGVNLGKGPGTIFYNVLCTTFELLGEDKVSDPKDYMEGAIDFSRCLDAQLKQESAP